MEPCSNKKITLVLEKFSLNTERGNTKKHKRLANLSTESKGSENKLKIRKYSKLTKPKNNVH